MDWTTSNDRPCVLGEQACAAAKARKKKKKDATGGGSGGAAASDADADAYRDDADDDDASLSPVVLYASGEESVEQLAGRAERLNVDPEGVMVYSATRLEARGARACPCPFQRTHFWSYIHSHTRLFALET